MSKLHITMIFWSKTLLSKALIIITYHYVYLDGFKNSLSNEACDFEQSMYEINSSQRWTPKLEINTNPFPVWGFSIAMHLFVLVALQAT